MITIKRHLTIVVNRNSKYSVLMSETFNRNVEEIKKIFHLCTPEEKYSVLIEWGKKLPLYPNEFKTADRIVAGCQSILHLHSECRNEKIYFQAASDALISAGLAAILIAAYSGESAETILKCPPLFLKELGLDQSLSPSRSNGLYQIHLRMKREALKYLI